jgi:hypothetical protein
MRPIPLLDRSFSCLRPPHIAVIVGACDNSEISLRDLTLEDAV